MSGDQLRRLKQLENENKRLRRAVADLTLAKQILSEAARATPEPLLAPSVHRACPQPARSDRAESQPDSGIGPLHSAPNSWRP